MKFLASGVQEESVMVLATIFFFVGVVIVLVMDVLVHQLEHAGSLNTEPQPAFSPKASCEMEPVALPGTNQKSATYRNNISFIHSFISLLSFPSCYLFQLH